jgi:peptidyl-prolyl cis-trans isomerase D
MQVLNKENGTEEFDAKSEESTLSTMSSRFASNFINDLYMKANIKDDRYLYF